MPAGELESDQIFARMREYVATRGRTPELRRLRDRVEHPGAVDFWDPFDIWDPSEGSYCVGLEPRAEHGR